MLRLRCFQHLTNHALKHRDWLLRILQNALIRQRITFDQMHMWYAVNTAQVDEIIRNDFNPATFPVHFYDEDNEELQMRQNFQTRQVSAKYIYHLISLIARRSTGDLVETNASVFFFKQGVSPLHLFLLSLVVNAGMAQFAAAAQVLSSEDPGDITAFEFEYMKENLMLPTSIAIFQTAIMGPAKALRAYEFVSTKFEDLQFGNTYLALLKHLVTVMDLQTAITLGPGVNYGLRSIIHEDPKVVGSVRGLPLHSRLLQDGQKLSLAGRQTLWNLAQLG